MTRFKNAIAFVALFLAQGQAFAQQPAQKPSGALTLEQCIAFALENQPVIRQALIDEAITESTIKSRLADWYPQVNFAYNLQHNFEVQTSIIGGNPVKLGVDNTSGVQFTATQNLFNRDVLLASRSKNDVRLQAKQSTASTKIDVAVQVTKAFYDIMTTQQQIRVSDENINRLERSLKDARSRYEAGITDKTDYKRATIALNNTIAARQAYTEALAAKKEYLKTLMGIRPAESLEISFDTAQLENQMKVDTLQLPDYSSRIEYRLLETQRRLQQANLDYNKWSYIPNLSLNGAYNLNFLNDKFSKLYSVNYPNAFANISLVWPIFQGGKRTANIRTAEWQLRRTDVAIESLENDVNAEYAQAMANYRSTLASFNAVKENLDLAREVYDVIDLQYKSGIKTYLEVITAETDLRTAEINYYEALYRLLAGKTDVQRALGQINY